MIKNIQPLEGFIQALKNPSISNEQSYEPIIFQLKTSEVATFHRFCQAFSIRVIDHIDRQLEDLVRVQNPAITDKVVRIKQVEALLKDKNKIADTTNWVYFPWLQKVVHILQQEDYFSVITNRNVNTNFINLLLQQQKCLFYLHHQRMSGTPCPPPLQLSH